MRVVTPFRPFPIISDAHQLVGPFDWVEAIRMLSASVTRACGCDTVTLTDIDTTLPVPTFQYATRERRLMLWILEVSRAYLASDDFDRDTVMVSPDMLVFQPLAPYFQADLGILVRTGKFSEARPVLNSVQWWAHAGKDRLVAWYDAAIAYAASLSEELITWGADTEPFVDLLAPLEPDTVAMRGDLRVSFLPCERMAEGMRTSEHVRALAGYPVRPRLPVVDFRYRRKLAMRDYFNATVGAEVTR